MKIVRASHLGMCFGVRNAIKLALQAAAAHPLTVVGELVHNDIVLNQLRAAGIEMRDDVDDIRTSDVMITAHGMSDRRLAVLRSRHLRILDATCPLVRAAHRAVATLAREGFHPVIVGRRDHVEVRGLTEDLDAFDVVLTEEDIANLQPRPIFGIAAQTTQPLARLHHVASLIRCRFPKADVRVVDTICTPTKLRQRAAIDLARRSDVTIVVGGAHSNNTRELAATCGRHCQRVFQVQTPDDLRPAWFDGARVVGVTAGTSTPEAVIDAVENRLRALGNGRAAA